MSIDAATVPIGSGRLRQDDLNETDRNFSIAMHLTPLACVLFGPAIFTPLVLWLVRKDGSSFNDDHGREVVNMLLTGLILSIALIFIPIIGWLALAIWYVAAIVGMIRGAVAAGRGEYFRYPMTFRML